MAAPPLPHRHERHRSAMYHWLAAAGFGAAMLPAAAVAQGVGLPEIQVVTTSPLPGAGLDRDKVPAMVQTLSADDFQRTYSPSVTDTLMQRIPGVSTTDVQGNGFVQDLRYRGFVASPVPGTPQGIAVYLNGIRVNEAFGDTVNWDLIPTNAIDRADVWTNNPVFGLNALGGAVNIRMKNGFTYQASRPRGRAAPTAASRDRCSMARDKATSAFMSRRRPPTTTAGATIRRRRSRASMPISAGRATARKST